MVKKELLDILACPQCKGPVEINNTQTGLICRNCKLLYPIKEDIPVMLIDEAVLLDKEDGPAADM